MNFNYDLATWIDYFIGAFACCFGSYITGKIILNKSIISFRFKNMITIIFLSLLTIVNTLIFNNIPILKIFGIFIILFIIYKVILKENNVSSFLLSIINYAIILVSEVGIISLLVTFIEKVLKVNMSISNIPRSIYINVLIILFTCLIARLLKNKIYSFVKKHQENSFIYIIVIGVGTIFIMISTMNSLYLNNWKIDYQFILHIIIFFGCIVFFIIILKQYLSNKEINDKYLLLNDYLKSSAELIERYSSTVHKYKNNLIAIKGYLKTDNEKADKYIDSLLDTYEFRKYNWIKSINNIQLDAIRYLVYYKLSKAENNELKINVDVSKDINKIDNDKITNRDINNLLDIIGELFDNAIYASNESKEKELNIIIYEENCVICFILSNTFKGKVDLSLLNKNGYTTKGEGHGLGLYDIDKTIKKNSKYNIKYEIIDNYFTVTLMVNIK